MALDDNDCHHHFIVKSISRDSTAIAYDVNPQPVTNIAGHPARVRVPANVTPSIRVHSFYRAVYSQRTMNTQQKTLYVVWQIGGRCDSIVPPSLVQRIRVITTYIGSCPAHHVRIWREVRAHAIRRESLVPRGNITSHKQH